MTRQKLTPPEIAKRWGVSPEQIIRFIRSGELRAINVATNPAGRPRFLIDIRDLQVFEQRRSVSPTSKVRRSRSQPGIIHYF